MRIRVKDAIYETDKISIHRDAIWINSELFQTGRDTEEIAKQLLTKGYADLSYYTVTNTAY